MENWPGDPAPFSSQRLPPFSISADLSSIHPSSSSSSISSGICGCGVDRTCFNSTKSCNCDSQSSSWQSDGGFINSKVGLHGGSPPPSFLSVFKKREKVHGHNPSTIRFFNVLNLAFTAWVFIKKYFIIGKIFYWWYKNSCLKIFILEEFTRCSIVLWWYRNSFW